MMDFMFGGNAAWFSVPAVVGTAFFALKIVLMLVGGAADADFDLDADVDVGDLDHVDASGDSFKLLSVQAIGAFAMGFGWGGLSGLRGFGWGFPESFLAGFVTGVVMVWFLLWLLKAVAQLQSTGNIPIGSTLGASGDVYLTIPPRSSGKGQVRIVVDERQRFYHAVTEGDEIPRKARVRVMKVNDDNTLTVAPE